MSGVSEKQLIKLGSWPLGIDNMSEESSMPRDQDGVVRALRVADNVDISKDGKPQRRDGYEQIQTSTTNHSLYCDGWPFGFQVRDGSLCTVTEDGSYTPIVTGLSLWDQLTYVTWNDRVYWSNGSRNGEVRLDGDIYPLGVEMPPPPVVQAVAGGGLFEGEYQVTLTWQRANGEEGGAPEGVLVFVDANGGIRVSDIPTPADTSLVRANIYVTQANGDIFYRSASVPRGVSTFLVGIGDHSKRLDTQFLERLPPASIMRRFNAQMLAAVGRRLIWSPPVRPTLTNTAENGIGFGGDLTMIEAIDQSEGAGVYVGAAGNTWWLDGTNPHKDWQLRRVHPYGALPGSIMVPGSAFKDAAHRVAYWLDSAGFFCKGGPGGVVERIGSDQFNAGVTERTAQLYRESKGERHVVTAMIGGTPQSTMAFGDTMTTELIRNGNRVDCR